VRRVIVVLSVALLFLAAPQVAHAASSCGDNGFAGNCEVSNTGTGVQVGASDTRPGSGREQGGDYTDHSDGGSDSPDAAAPPSECGTPTLSGPFCRGNYDVAGLPDVTLADLVSFVPARPSLAGEPAGIGVVGMPMNLVAEASGQDIPGRLLGYDVVVRFTPAGFRFSYGDGASRTSSTGGSSWAALGQADFTATSTSHAYAARGTYTAGVTALYSAAVNFGTGTWRPVAGYVEATTGGYGVRVVEVHTALVDKTCLENPRGPGC
jgi:hypothetical protein